MNLSLRVGTIRGFGVLLLLCMLFLSAGAVGAAPAQQQATPLDVFCVKGSVINHAEQASSGWTITGVMYDPTTGLLDPATASNVQTIDVTDSKVGPLGSFRFDGLKAGRWNFSIGARAGWSPVTDASFDVNLAFGATECQTIRFKMKQDVTVNVLKISATHEPLANFIIHAKPGTGNHFASPVDKTTGADGMAVFTLTPGLWEFSETAPNGVSANPVSPVDGKQSLNVEVPGPYLIRFKNRIVDGSKGCIEVIKRDVPPAASGQDPVGLPGWFISVLRADNSTVAEGKTDAAGRIIFKDLPFGPYTVHEQLPLSGWEAAAPVHYSVTLADTRCVQVEFSNRQVEPAFCIVGRKVDANGNVGLPGWEIKAKPTVTTNYEPGAVTTDGLGYFRIDFPANDYRVPGAEYNVCETLKDGWLAHTATCQKVKLPTVAGLCAKTGFDFENQQVGHSSVPATGCSATYTVKAGDQLYRIGSSHGKTPKQMRDANPSIKNPNLIRPGQQICIP